MKSIVFLNAESVQTICLAKSFRKLGYDVTGLCESKLSSGYVSRWLNKRLTAPVISEDEEAFCLFLDRFLKSNHTDAIIPLADSGANFLSRHKMSLEKKFGVICAIPENKIFRLASNKNLLMSLCEKHGIPHPKTIKLSKENLEDAGQIIGFPSLIKPDHSQGAKGIVKVSCPEELSHGFSLISQQFGNCSLQEYVEQPDHYFNVMLYRRKDGTISGSATIIIRRFFPIKGGSSCYCETILMPELTEMCKQVLDLIDWKGFADFDVLEDKKSGELKIIEINPRVPSSLAAAFSAGVDFGSIYAADLFGEKPKEYKYKEGMQVRWLGLDVMWFLFSKDRFKFKPSWFRFFGKNVSYQDGSISDMLPMPAGMLAGVIKYLNPSFRKSKLGAI